MASVPEIMVGAGVAAILAAAVGGGLRAFGIEVPLVSSPARQVILGIVGLALLVAGVKIAPISGGIAGNGTSNSSAAASIPAPSIPTRVPESETFTQEEHSSRYWRELLIHTREIWSEGGETVELAFSNPTMSTEYVRYHPGETINLNRFGVRDCERVRLTVQQIVVDFRSSYILNELASVSEQMKAGTIGSVTLQISAICKP